MNRAADGAVSSSDADLAVLGVLADREKAELLGALIAQDATLAARAGREARSRLAAVDIADVAIVFAEGLLGLDQEELSRHAGGTRDGYVEPTEAAWSLLEVALEPWREDIARRARRGFDRAARQIGLGVLEGLRQAGDGDGNDERLLSWAPDFTEDARKRHRGATARRSRHRDRPSRRARHVIAPSAPPGDIDHPRRTLSGTVESPRSGCGGTHPDDRVVA